jgi:hypothetical protein
MFVPSAAQPHDYIGWHLFVVLRWTNVHNINLSGYPNIGVFIMRVAARPAEEAMKAVQTQRSRPNARFCLRFRVRALRRL